MLITTKNKKGQIGMDYDKRILQDTPLFSGICGAELSTMLDCLQARTKQCKRGEYLLIAGDKPEYVGIVLSGQIHIAKDDIRGNRTLIAALSVSDIFGEALCSADVEESPVSVFAATDAAVLILDVSRLLYTCPKNCSFHQTLIINLLRIVARKNLYLQNRMELVSARSIRAKILSYLDGFAKKQGRTVQIQLNREEMADYLSVERSALSHELMRMKEEGILDYHRNQFTLL